MVLSPPRCWNIGGQWVEPEEVPPGNGGPLRGSGEQMWGELGLSAIYPHLLPRPAWMVTHSGGATGRTEATLSCGLPVPLQPPPHPEVTEHRGSRNPGWHACSSFKWWVLL